MRNGRGGANHGAAEEERVDVVRDDGVNLARTDKGGEVGLGLASSLSPVSTEELDHVDKVALELLDAAAADEAASLPLWPVWSVKDEEWENTA